MNNESVEKILEEFRQTKGIAFSSRIEKIFDRLPSDFDFVTSKNYKNKWGYTLAHYAALTNKLPDNFDYAAFKDAKSLHCGNTPAHIAAMYGNLPADFDYEAFYDCKNSDGDTPGYISLKAIKTTF
jgi:hypothetical protein